VSKTFSFPVWLEGTEEQQKAEAERQALTRASFTRAHLTESERLVGRGKLLEDTARQNLNCAKRKDRQARILAQNQLADAIAMQGRFAEAAQTHTDKTRRKYFRDVGKAIEKPDEEKCSCSDRKAKVGDNELEITPRFERAQIFSPVHNEVVSLVECSKCRHLNARPLRSRLLKHNDAIAQNEAAVKGKHPIRITDAQLLNAGT